MTGLKLIIQIPCFNEAPSLPVTLSALPRHVDGFDRVEWLVIDDGSTDDTIAVAKRLGVDHIIPLHHNYGLARAFMAGVEACLKLGADVIVNTDADNQYDARDIPKLVRPILEGRAEIVVGARPIDEIAHFSRLKKWLQLLGSFVVQKLSQTDVADAPSGFRAMHRRAAMQLNVFNDFSYTIETIIQAGQKNMPIMSVPIRVNAELRPSRLFRSMTDYVSRMLFIMTRIFVIYRALRFFTIIGMTIMTPGVLLGMRYVWLMLHGRGMGNIQSLILAAVLLLAGFFVILSGFLADLVSVNRKMLEELRFRMMRLEQDMALPTAPERLPRSRPHLVKDDEPALAVGHE